MANFNTHFVVAGCASAVVSGTLLSMQVITPTQSIMAFAIGTFGGLMPDIDSDNSKAIGVGFTILSILITILLVFLTYYIYSLVEMLIMSGVLFFIFRILVIDIFRKISKHRGMFHSIPVALIWGLLTAILMYQFFGLNSLISWIYGFMMSFGYIVHLILDEIYSVDLGNRRMKKSSGTAFKFYQSKTTSDKIQTILIYLFLIFLLSVSPDTSFVKDALFSPEAWIVFKDVLLPDDGRWFFH
ncbi:MAG: metal-dependent hydrolase [Sulfurovaceae bacterium]|nr:metal-dependent hydrolase [Sulfurovaceae bacterium]